MTRSSISQQRSLTITIFIYPLYDKYGFQSFCFPSLLVQHYLCTRSVPGGHPKQCKETMDIAWYQSSVVFLSTRPWSMWVFGFYIHQCPNLLTCRLSVSMSITSLVKLSCHLPLSASLKEIYHAFTHGSIVWQIEGSSILYLTIINVTLFIFFVSVQSPPLPCLPNLSKGPNKRVNTCPEDSLISLKTSLSSYSTPLL